MVPGLAAACLAAAVSTGCGSPLDAPSAFASERYLCGPEQQAELDALVEACRQGDLRDGACFGVESFQGVLDGQPVVVDAPIVEFTYSDGARDGGMARNVSMKALAPYFGATLSLVFMLDAQTGLMTNAGLAGVPEYFNLEARGGNYLVTLQSATREIQSQTADEVRAKVSASISRGGSLDFCFHVFLKRPAR